MFVKEVKKPRKISKTEVLFNRISESHSKRNDVKLELSRHLRGYNGERSLTYYLNQLPEKDYYIFHNLRLPHGKYYFQIDFLIICSRFVMILECKNFYGTLFFEKDFKQLIRSVNGQEEGFTDPITQARWHRTQLTNWLNINGFSSIPIEFLFMINDPSTIVKIDNNHSDAKRYVAHNYVFLDRFNLINRTYKNEVFDRKLIKRLSKKLIFQHVEEDPDLLRRFRINVEEIIKGIRCPSCLTYGMKRSHGKWVCQKCKISSKDAHLQALSDYFLLISTSITNKQFREFLLLSDPNAATYLLKNLNLSQSGSKKGRIYYEPLQK